MGQVKKPFRTWPTLYLKLQFISKFSLNLMYYNKYLPDKTRNKELMGIAFYTPVLLFYYYIIKYYDHIYENNSSSSQDFNNLKRFRKYYFTGWNLSAQIYFIYVALADEISTICSVLFTIRRTLHLVRCYLFAAIIFPCTLLVTSLFWCLYALDRELVFPRNLDAYYSPWMVHSVHSFVVLPLVVEIYLNKGNGVVNLYALPLLTAFLLVYKITFLTVYLRHGIWLYPVFNYLSWWQRIFFLTLLYFTTVVFLYLGLYLQHLRLKRGVKFAGPTAVTIE